MPSENPRDLDHHFAFGENWASYAKLVDDAAISRAKTGLLKLVPMDELKASTFLDIGSGSGLHSLAAALLGAAKIVAVDIDPVSTETTRELLEERAPGVAFEAKEASVFDLSPDNLEQFDIVYSWGVLHHTGDLRTAMKRASRLVRPGGLLVVALYRRTHLDWFWTHEKKWYSRASRKWQRRARRTYDMLFRVARAVTGRSGPEGERGMEYWHDLHDWLGGYPYETILAPEVDQMLSGFGFSKEQVFAHGKSLGIFGSGCDEYVYRHQI